MPESFLGQLITFAIEVDQDEKYSSYIRVNVKVGDTVQKIAAHHGHPEEARDIADLNHIRSVKTVLRHHPRRKTDLMKISLPGTLRQGDVFHVLAGDEPPRPIAGYQKLETVDRPGRTGLTRFTGYDPITLEVPIRFENVRGGEGSDIENDIQLLERMAGRGDAKGAGTGPAPIIRISVTSSSGKVVPLISANYQWTGQNPAAPVWRIANIDWDTTVGDGVLRNDSGNRIRQKATVTLQQHTGVSIQPKAVAARAKAKSRSKAKAKKRHK